VVETFVDEESQGRKGREAWPALERLMNTVIREEVDVVATWSVGQLGRSLQDLLTFFEQLRSREVDQADREGTRDRVRDDVELR
jgi:DNA invertase Pin-like site-specific DNA recombinase